MYSTKAKECDVETVRKPLEDKETTHSQQWTACIRTHKVKLKDTEKIKENDPGNKLKDRTRRLWQLEYSYWWLSTEELKKKSGIKSVWQLKHHAFQVKDQRVKKRQEENKRKNKGFLPLSSHRHKYIYIYK